MSQTVASAGKAREARRWERYDLQIPVTVCVLLNGERCSFRGEASDISRGGMGLFAARNLDLGATLQLEFLVPYNAKELSVRGVIRNRRGFSYGIEFVHPTHYQQQTIERTCQVLKLLR